MAQEFVFMDIETRSRMDIRKVGAYRYLADESTEAMCVAFKLREDIYVWAPFELPRLSSQYTMLTGPIEEIPVIQDLAQYPWVAHNGNSFDRIFWDLRDLPQPTAWVDTIHLARICGFQGGLDSVGKELLGRQKLKMGKKVMLKYAKNPDLDLTTAALAAIVHYCVEDVEIMEEVFPYVRAGLKVDAEIRWADQRINNRGFAIDLERAATLLDAAVESRERIVEKAFDKFGLTLKNLRSPTALLEWFHNNGYLIPNVQSDTLKGLDGIGAEVAAARNEASRTSFGKVSYMLDAEVDGRLRHQFAYHSAHTSRWGGRGVQPQNLNRGVLSKEEMAAALEDITVIHSFDYPVGDIFTSLIRPCIVAGPEYCGLGIYDYSAIEVRGVDWVAGEKARMIEHAANLDPYRRFVKLAFDMDVEKKHPMRNAVKPVVLGCGYGMGPDKLQGYAEGMGIDLADTGRTPEELVNLYRDSRPKVAGIWTTLDSGITYLAGGL